MVDLLSSGEEGEMWLLTIWRNGKFFEIFTRGPLGGIFEFTRPEESQMIMDLFLKRDMGQKEGQEKIEGEFRAHGEEGTEHGGSNIVGKERKGAEEGKGGG